jgi:hypothetical protein
MSDLPKSVVNKDGNIYLPLSWKEAYHLRYLLRQHVRSHPDEHLARSVLRRMESGDPDQEQDGCHGGNVVQFPSRPRPDEPRVIIALNKGVIVAKHFDYVCDGGLTGVIVRCDDGGSEHYIVDSPTMAEYYGLELPEGASYEKKKRAVMVAAGWDFDEECEWLQTDGNGDALPEYETDEVIDAWLNALLIDVDIDRHAHFCERIATEYTPGFIIWDRLPPHEAERLGFGNADLGGPASYVPCVSTKASAEELNWVLERYGLPFTFLDEDGRTRGPI